MKRLILILFFFCMILSSCMISTTYPKNEFKEKIPCSITKDIFIPHIFFEDKKTSINLILCRFDYLYKKVNGIKICFTNGNNYFPENKSINIQSLKIRYKNGKEISAIVKNIETENCYEIVDDSSKESSFGYPLAHAPEGLVGEYRIIMEFNEVVKLKKADSLELQILITEDGATTEITKVFHFDLKYETSTESMFGAWVRRY